MRALSLAVLPAVFSIYAVAQAPAPVPEFEIAQVKVAPKRAVPSLSTKALGNTYEVRNATMLDLIGIAWGGFDHDRIVGGPNWLELDRFDVIGRMPPDTTAEARRLMLRPLLEQRFKLVTHNDTRPLPFYALTAGKKVQMKEADGKGEVGCKRETGPVVNPGAMKFTCRNMSMAAFAEGLRTMGVGQYVGYQAVLDRTGLEGRWDFDVRWSISLGFNPNPGETIPFPEALEKQLGLKLEQVLVPTPVLVVDSVNRTPTDDPPGTAEAFPPVPVPTEFEVATLKPSGPERGAGRFMTPVGGRLDSERTPLKFLINRAFNAKSEDQVTGIPAWADTARFDIEAKAPTTGLPGSRLDNETVAPMLLALLKERLKMTWHTEDRMVTAYSLKAVKPRMKKADPTSRTRCTLTLGPPAAPPGEYHLGCRNVTMAEFSERLQAVAPGLGRGVTDATSLEGGWDVSLTYLPYPMAMPVRRAGDNPADAADPVGDYTIFEAVEKQLGLKLEAQKRSGPVIVIDHIEPAPTEN